MAWDLEATKRSLRELGLRVTAPRVAVMRVLAEAERPLSHGESFERLGRDALWDKATVYRNLMALTEAGLVRIATRAGGLTRFELASRDDSRAHPHFVCSDCGHVSCLPSAEVPVPKRVGWGKALSNAAVQFVGQCPNCCDGA